MNSYICGKIIFMAADRYQPHDFYQIDELLTDEQKLVRDSAREWLKKEVSPII